jgi:hypothetical protein
MDMDDNDEHEAETDRAKMTDRHETGDSTTLGSGRRARRKSHVVMPPLDADSDDGKTEIKPTSDM